MRPCVSVPEPGSEGCRLLLEAFDAAGIAVDTGPLPGPLAATMSAALDLRLLPAPEPLQRILAELEQLPRHAQLVALTPQWPAPLLDLLDAHGYAYHLWALPDHGTGIAICHAADAWLLKAPPYR